MSEISGIGGLLRTLHSSETVRKGTAASETDRGKLESAATEFEALFLSQMLSAMRATIGESGDKGFGQTTYTEMFDQEVARSLAQRGALGIAELLLRNLDNRDAAARNTAENGVEMGGIPGKTEKQP